LFYFLVVFVVVVYDVKPAIFWRGTQNKVYNGNYGTVQLFIINYPPPLP